MAPTVKVSSKGQIAIPAEARRRLKIKPGDRLDVVIGEGHLYIVPEESDWAERLRGLHKEVWEGVDPDEYVRKERQGWTE